LGRPENWQESDYVFATSTGAPWTGAGVLNTFQAQLVRAGFPKMRRAVAIVMLVLRRRR